MAKLFKVRVRELVDGYYELEADSAKEAKRIAADKYYDGDKVWDGFTFFENLESAEITAEEIEA